MKIEYDAYYKTENLFGKPYPELLDFYDGIREKGNLLDLGCSQRRDSIPLARLGFTVTAVDHSKVGINQLNKIATREKLPLKGYVENIYNYSDFDNYDFILISISFFNYCWSNLS